VILNGLKFVNTSPAKINLVNITSNIGLKNIKSFYLYGAECEDLLIENCKIGYYEVTNAINAVFKNCQMNRFSTAIAFENGDFDSVTEQSFSSGSGFSVSVPIPINTVKNYLIVVNANGRTATLKTAIITVVNGSANSEVYELASYGELSVIYEIANDMLKITPSDNYGGTITVKAI
jgi:hypothetical protein